MRLLVLVETLSFALAIDGSCIDVPIRPRVCSTRVSCLFRWTWCAGKSVCLLSLRDLLASPSAFSLDVVRVDSLDPVGSELSVLCTVSCYGRRAIDVKRSSSRFRILPRSTVRLVVLLSWASSAVRVTRPPLSWLRRACASITPMRTHFPLCTWCCLRVLGCTSRRTRDLWSVEPLPLWEKKIGFA